MADDEVIGDFQEFASLLKARPGGSFGKKFHHRHSLRGRGSGFFNRQHDQGRGFHSSYVDSKEKFSQTGRINGYWARFNGEKANNIDPQYPQNGEGNSRMQNPQYSHERIYGHGRGHGRGRHYTQFFNNRFHGCGRWKSRGNLHHKENFYHHGVSGYEEYEDTEISQSFGYDLRESPTDSGNHRRPKFFVHGHGKMVGRGCSFHGSFKRTGSRFGNKVLEQILNSKKGTASAPLPIILHGNVDDKSKDDDIDAKTCSTGSLPAMEIVGFAPLSKKKVRKIKAASLIQSPPEDVSQLPAPTKNESGKEGSLCQAGDVATKDDQKHQKIDLESEDTRLQEEAVIIEDKECQGGELEKEDPLLKEGKVTIFVDQRHQERAFISCIGGNRKRPRSAAVRDFPVKCTSLRLSVAKKIKSTPIESKAAATDSMVANSIGECASLPKLEARIENSSDLSISDVHVELVQVDPEHSFEDCKRAHIIGRDGSAELLQSSSEILKENATVTSCKGDMSAELLQARHEAAINNSSCEVDTVDELVLSSPESDDKRKTVLSKENGCTDLVRVCLEVNYENSSEPAVAAKDDLLEPVQIGPENIMGDNTITGENDKNHSTELVQVDLQEASMKECHAKIKTAEKIRCNGNGASSHLAVETLQVMIPPQIPAVATFMPIHTSSKGISHSVVVRKKETTVVERKKKKASLDQKAQLRPSDGAIKKTLRQSKLDKLSRELIADRSTDLHNQGNMSMELNVVDFLETTEPLGALVPYQNSNGVSMKNKEHGRSIFYKGSNRAKHFQTSKSLDSVMLSDPAKGLSLESTEGASSRSLVKRTLQEYEYIRKVLVKSKDPVRRPDLDAGSLLKERGKWRNCGEKIVGEVPGVEVGDQFSFRMEMLIIGLHRQVQSGIDYILGTKRNNGASLAISIVSSGGYENDEDEGNTLIYSGHGGNNSKGNKKQESNQELVRGNLALSNSMKEGTPVRVIKGTTDHTSPSSKIYTYDGLYDVVNCRFDCGATGFGVYHFTLTRRAGQPQVGLSLLSNLKKKGLARPYLLLDDISLGQEKLPVCVVNEVDEETAPLNFTYIPKIKHPVWYTPLVPQGCSCLGVCDEETCGCAVKNGGELPYNEKGYLVRDKNVVYECGISCSCSSSCENRVSQKGLRYRLEVFKTKNRGWGVRSLDPIQSGGFICEYSGELLTDAEAEQRVGNDEYLFDLGNGCTPSRDQHNLAEMEESAALDPATEEVAYTIDAKDMGNVARFINHSCSPNLYAQNVLYDSDDLRFPHVMLFAMESIPPLREFTYDYNYRIGQVSDALGNVKTKACHCGAQDCQGRLY